MCWRPTVCYLEIKLKRAALFMSVYPSGSGQGIKESYFFKFGATCMSIRIRCSVKNYNIPNQNCSSYHLLRSKGS